MIIRFEKISEEIPHRGTLELALLREKVVKQMEQLALVKKEIDKEAEKRLQKVEEMKNGKN